MRVVKLSIIAVLLSGTVLSASLAYAQSETDGIDAAPEDAATSVSQQPTPVDSMAYLQMAESMPFGLWESRLNDTLRMYRLGIITRDAAKEQFDELGSAARITAAQLEALTPPPQFAAVRTLNIDAALQYAAAFDLGPSTLDGDETTRAAANDHIAQAEDLAAQALQQLR